MKRLHIWLLALLLVLALAACGEEESRAAYGEEEEIVTPQPEAEEDPAPPEELPEEPAEEPEQNEEEQPDTPPPAQSGGSTKPVIPQSEKAYLARINLTHCVVNIMGKDENGEYTVPVKAMLCSTGYATPTGGFYRLGSTWEWLRLKGNVYGHYVTQIRGNILFHSVPYLRRGDPASLEYWEFDKLGVKASQGCIRLQVSDAIWIYENAWNIVGAEFYSDDEPGPFGKPTAPKISDNEFCRDWDPTDPDPANPWHDHVEGGMGEGVDPETGLPLEGTPAEGEDPGGGEIPAVPGGTDAPPAAAPAVPGESPAEPGAGEGTTPEEGGEAPAEDPAAPDDPAAAPGGTEITPGEAASPSEETPAPGEGTDAPAAAPAGPDAPAAA